MILPFLFLSYDLILRKIHIKRSFKQFLKSQKALECGYMFVIM